MKTLRQFVLGLTVAFAASAAYASGIPQMDQTWYPNQLLWLAVSFTLLYLLVSGSIAPTIGRVLSNRESAINTAIREAEAAKHAAESTRGNVESALKTARTKASELMVAAQAENAANAAEAIAKLDHDLHRKADQAGERIAVAVAKAADQTDAAVASLAHAISEKLLGTTLSNSATLRKKA